MLLATRCPFCETVFRIQPQQLAARHGLVRCGHCQESFDASGSLFEMPVGGDFSQAIPLAATAAADLIAAAASGALDTSASPAATSPSSAAGGAPDFANPSWDAWAPRSDSAPGNPLRYSGDRLPEPSVAPDIAPRAQSGPAEPRLTPEANAAPAPAPMSWKEANAQPAEPAKPAAPTERAERAERTGPQEPTFSPNAALTPDAAEPHLSSQSTGAAFGDLPPPTGTPFAMTREAPARAPRRTGWRIVGVLFALLLLALLGAQIAWWLRETVMVYVPDSVPLYQQACAKIGCHVLPPRDIDGLQVEPSDLRQVDDPHHLELKMPLRNHFDVALAYPAIELTLLDRQNAPVLRRVLWPQDYVPPGTAIEAGLPAHTTQTMIVRLDTGNVVASNFRIEVFYP
ncbi:MAG TPA: zinc-ribbon and DUF3426 domain-containing protein [Paraburkholderia sp.]|jgi:predicted Zn finger-like uncharacterized protein|nr:zinc-ribbon and DUF3426 domain-containing protein [Paraburkholderia sp.]